MYFDNLNASASATLATFTSESNANYTGWSHPKFDSYVKKIRSLPQKAQGPFIKKAINLLIEESPVIPLYRSTWSYLIKKRVKNYQHSPYGHSTYQFVSIDSQTNK